ncbi:bap31 domain-containing protein [Trichonephila inaurata madagascariensis]|uniref:Endoplasmic reticulum transmembrane protein n=1 Tax=Trichonephila inaurata madagascariensis TaxID=2747483 RepID=A0A8X7CG56_9ARAC|nr:bap31 domain-containing protein [Trichonephila inaurata madagascariensis]
MSVLSQRKVLSVLYNSGYNCPANITICFTTSLEKSTPISFVESYERKSKCIFFIFLIVLVLFFLDSIREMMKYSAKHSHDYEAELQMQMKLFRSQRNYYIVGFAIFLSLVIRRLIMLILEESELLAKNEEAMKKAQEATENLQKLEKEAKEVEELQSSTDEKFLKEIVKLEDEMKKKDHDLISAEQELEDLKNRNEQISKECKDLIEKINTLKGTA